MSRKEPATDKPQATGRAKVVAVMNQKGGVGKTTISLALASAARAAGQSVAVFDLDPQASATRWVMSREQVTGVRDPGFAVMSMAGQAMIVEDAIRRESLAGRDWIFIDTAPTAAGISPGLVGLTDVVLVPVGDGAFDLTATAPTLELIKAGGRSPILIFNRLPSTARRATQDLAATFREVVSGIAIGPDLASRAEIKHAQAAMRSIGEFKPNSRATAEVLRLWNYVQRCFMPTPATPRTKEAAHV